MEAGLWVGLGVRVISADISQATPDDDKHVFDNMCPLLVKMYATSQPAGEFSGFLYSSSSPLIVSAGHNVGFMGHSPGSAPPAQRFRARYFDGFEEEVEVLKAAANCLPDVAVLRGSRCAPRSLSGVHCIMGDTVYALGFMPLSNTPTFSKGIVPRSTVGTVPTTAHADRGYSGGPVVNIRGHLLGIVKGEIGAEVMQVSITPAVDVHTFLLQSGQPGLAT